MVALVDDQDYERVSQFNWFASKPTVTGRITASRRVAHPTDPKKQQSLYLHRFILNAPPGLVVDHINGNGLDNRRCNLRLATHSQNHANVGLIANNKTGYKGVSVCSKTGKYRVRVHLQGRQLWGGYFTDLIEAARAHDAKAKEVFGGFARLNFPEESR
jgi:hypothetical protein